MSRPSISMACILKNEAHNLGPLLRSVRWCFDEIIMVDTGSTDGTLDFLEKINAAIEAKDPNWEGYPKIRVEHFTWIEDFAAARNYAFSFATKDYVFWMDGDDEMSDPKDFIHWRDTTMHAAHYWVALYNYAFSSTGAVECKFIRERVIKRNHGFKWEYFVHEGLIQVEGKKFWPQRANSWWINHRRTAEDQKLDHMRNVKLFESKPYETLAPRMKFYMGKELFENGFPEKAGRPLMDALKDSALDVHDRILAIQYAAHTAMTARAIPQAIDLLMNGLRIMMSRAEYWCLLGDCYSLTGQLGDAITAYQAALLCQPNDLGGVTVCYEHAYGEHPHMRLGGLFLNLGQFDKAEDHIKWLEDHGHTSSHSLRNDHNRLKDLGTIRTDLPKTNDVIISCPPGSPVTDWDENSLALKGHGGSETAAIEVAKWIKLKTNRNVKIFHPRAKREVMASGVEYLPIEELVGYSRNVEPAAHIAWRHPMRVTNAKSYIWCHDLQCPGAINVGNYDKIVALSEFHKNYLMETNNIPENKIVLGFNGINPKDFEVGPTEKDPLKVVFSSSPDRGLVQAIDIVKKARAVSGLDLKLHCFYGFDNMRKCGQGEWADKIEKHVTDHKEFVVFHGMVTKPVLMKHFRESAVWLYVNDFIETYCLTAIEAMCSGTWPIVRNMGALKHTMRDALASDACDFMEIEVLDDASIGLWANTLMEAILDKKWERVNFSPKDYSWEKVADWFIAEFDLLPEAKEGVA